MKKILTIILSAVMLLSLAACGNGQASKQAPASTNTGGEKVKGNGKTLVVYYSATGTTKSVAETIAKATKGDLFEITPADKYTNEDLNYNNSNSRVCKEHESNDRNIKLATNTPNNWAAYDTVYIGYPIWWGIAAFPVETFVKSNDFTGKTVITFATAISSGFGSSGKILKEMSKNGTWIDGKCFHSTSAGDIQSWVKSL